jgi:hypothetical protein
MNKLSVQILCRFPEKTPDGSKVQSFIAVPVGKPKNVDNAFLICSHCVAQQFSGPFERSLGSEKAIFVMDGNKAEIVDYITEAEAKRFDG